MSRITITISNTVLSVSPVTIDWNRILSMDMMSYWASGSWMVHSILVYHWKWCNDPFLKPHWIKSSSQQFCAHKTSLSPSPTFSVKSFHHTGKNKKISIISLYVLGPHFHFFPIEIQKSYRYLLEVVLLYIYRLHR